MWQSIPSFTTLLWKRRFIPPRSSGCLPSVAFHRCDKDREAPAKEHGEHLEYPEHEKGKGDNGVANDVPGHAFIDKAQVPIQKRIEHKDDLQVDWQSE